MMEPVHNLAQTAKILGISTKTLMEHIHHGRIRCSHLGEGKKRKHRRFTDQNINTFLKKTKVQEVAPCPSQNQPKALSINTTSKSTVVAFSALQKPAPKKKLKQ